MKPYTKVAAGYLVFGILWIVLSDRIGEAVASDMRMLSVFQTLKGWLFVGLSGFLIYYLAKRAFERHVAAEREKMRVFRGTVAGVHHILLNYLNQMQFVTMEAERSRDFDPEILKLANEVSGVAEAELLKLAEIDAVTPEGIDSVIYRSIRGQ